LLCCPATRDYSANLVHDSAQTEAKEKTTEMKAQEEISDQDREDATSKVGESSLSQYRPNFFSESQWFLNMTPVSSIMLAAKQKIITGGKSCQGFMGYEILVYIY
jgi:hypothetical protein